MKRFVFRSKPRNNRRGVLVLTAGLLMGLVSSIVLAKGGEDDKGGRGRSDFYGIVQVRPADGWQGEWVLDGRTFIADQGTELDEKEGALRVGSCAKIHLRNGRVHEIDSEPMQDCK